MNFASLLGVCHLLKLASSLIRLDYGSARLLQRHLLLRQRPLLRPQLGAQLTHLSVVASATGDFVDAALEAPIFSLQLRHGRLVTSVELVSFFEGVVEGCTKLFGLAI